MNENWDVIIIGAGTAGLPTAIFAAARGGKVLLIESADDIGGTLHLSSGQMSAAGTRLQEKKAIDDSPDLHFEDVVRISHDTANRDLVRLAVYNAADTFEWLQDIGFVPLAEHPVKGQAHEPYSVERYYWGPELGVSILNVIRPKFEEVLANANVTLKLNTEVTELVQGNNGAVTGVIAKTKTGVPTTYLGQSILISTGGYVSDPVLYEELCGHPCYGKGSYPTCMGAGLKLGQAVGGYLRGKENYLTSFGVVLENDDFPSPVYVRPIHWPHMRMPWEIYVNANAERFIREDEPSVDIREHTILQQPDLRHWIIFDEDTLNQAPPIIPDWNLDDMRKAVMEHPMFFSANTIEELAVSTGLDPFRLSKTITTFNTGQKANTDALGRKHMPRAVENPPFYAIRSQGTSISSTVGLAVNGELQVIRANGSAIPGLYAAGEVLGAGSLMGGAFCGGMMVMPSLTYGRLLGSRMLPIGDEAEVRAAE